MDTYPIPFPLTMDLELLNSDTPIQETGFVRGLSVQLVQMKCCLAAHEIVAEVMATTSNSSLGWVPTHREIRKRCKASSDTIFYQGSTNKATFSFHSVGGSKLQNPVRITCDLSIQVDVLVSRLKDLRVDVEREAEKVPNVIKALEALREALPQINNLRKATGIPIRLVLNRPLEFT